MLTIDINNAYFALDTNFSVRVSAQNPACFTDKIPGDAGLAINIPVNDINRGILGAPERFEKYFPSGENGVRFANCTLRFAGVTILTGSLVVNGATDQNYDCWLQSEIGAIGETLQNKKITDFAWPTAQIFNNKTAYDDDTDPYGAPQIHNRGYWNGIGKEVENTIPTSEGDRTQNISKIQKEHFENFGYWINAIDVGVGVKLTGAGCVVSPMLHLRYVLREALRMNGFFIDKDALTPTGAGEGLALQKNMMIYNNFNIMAASYTQVTEIIEGWDQNTQSIGDAAYNVITVTSWGLSAFNYADLLPKISFKEFLLGIQNTLNYVFRFRNNGKVDIIDREAILSGSTIDINQYVSGFWEMGERISRRLKFTPEFDKEDAFFGSEYEDLTDRLSDFGEPVVLRTDLDAIVSPAIGELRLVTSENKIYEYKWNVVAAENVDYTEQQVDTFGWEFISNGTQPYIYQPNNETEEEIKVNCTTLSKLGGVFQYHAAVQKGNMAQMRSTWSDFGYRMIPANLNLWPNGMDWSGNTGLYNTCWKTWARFWAERQTVTGRFDLPLNVLLYVMENITSKFRTDKGEFIIEEIECEFGLNNIGITTVRGFKI